MKEAAAADDDDDDAQNLHKFSKPVGWVREWVVMCGVGFLCFLVTYKFEVSTIYATKMEQKLKKFVKSTTRIGFFVFLGV
jgi:hypothetical protein